MSFQMLVSKVNSIVFGAVRTKASSRHCLRVECQPKLVEINRWESWDTCVPVIQNPKGILHSTSESKRLETSQHISSKSQV